MRKYLLCAVLLLSGCERSMPFPPEELVRFERETVSQPVTPLLQSLSLSFSEREPEPSVVFKDGEYFVVQPKGEPKISFTAATEVGISSRIRAQVTDDSGIESMVLFEDGVKVFEAPNAFLTYSVVHHTSGVRTYHVQAYARDGGIAQSDGVKIAFSGVVKDSPPNVSFALEGARLMIRAVDEGDNAGIKTVIIHEDGVPIHAYDGLDGYFLRYFRLKDKSGKHEYHAVVKDAAHAVETKKIIVNF